MIICLQKLSRQWVTKRLPGLKPMVALYLVPPMLAKVGGVSTHCPSNIRATTIHMRYEERNLYRALAWEVKNMTKYLFLKKSEIFIIFIDFFSIF